MKIAFYAVDNSLDLAPRDFDELDNCERLVLEKLKELPNDEKRIYDLSTDDGWWLRRNIIDLMSDYNNEELDGGWWMIVMW